METIGLTVLAQQSNIVNIYSLSFTSRQRSCRSTCYWEQGHVQSSVELEGIALTNRPAKRKERTVRLSWKKTVLEREEAVTML